MIDLAGYEARLAHLQRSHPEMPGDAISLVRFVTFLQRRLDDHLANVLAAHGLNTSAWSLLMLIYSAPSQSIQPSQASEILRQSRPHMTRMSDELVARGWIARVRESADRRSIALHLTAQGTTAVEQIFPAIWNEYRRLVSHLSADELPAMKQMLRDWLNAVEHLPPARPEQDV